MSHRSGLEEVVLSVADLDRAATPLVQACGYRAMALPDMAADELALWGVGAGAPVRQQLMLPAQEDRGAIRLVDFTARDRRLVRPSQRTWDTGGIFDVDMFTADVRALYRRLQREYGWTAFGEPVDYVMGEFDVAQVVAQGADGMVLALIQPYKPPTIALPPLGAASRVFNSTQMVRDMDAALHFYRDQLGWTAIVDMTIDDAEEPGAEVLGLPRSLARTCRRRVAIVHPDGVNDGSVELIENVDLRGRDHAADAVAPNLGYLALRIRHPDPIGYAAAIVSRGGALAHEPVRLDLPRLGVVDLFAVRSPDGALLHIFDAAV